MQQITDEGLDTSLGSRKTNETRPGTLFCLGIPLACCRGIRAPCARGTVRQGPPRHAPMTFSTRRATRRDVFHENERYHFHHEPSSSIIIMLQPNPKCNTMSRLPYRPGEYSHSLPHQPTRLQSPKTPPFPQSPQKIPRQLSKDWAVEVLVQSLGLGACPASFPSGRAPSFCSFSSGLAPPPSPRGVPRPSVPFLRNISFVAFARTTSLIC